MEGNLASLGKFAEAWGNPAVHEWHSRGRRFDSARLHQQIPRLVEHDDVNESGARAGSQLGRRTLLVGSLTQVRESLRSTIALV